MPLLKQFWIVATLFIFLVIAVLVFAIWDLADSSPVTTLDGVTETLEANKETSTELATENPVPSDFPAPAKKLHQLINETESDKSLSLDEKVQQLDRRLAKINEQLKARGIDVPLQRPPAAPTDSDTEARLQAIKDHINHKKSSSN